MNLQVEAYFDSLKTWQQLLTKLRATVLECGLDEDFKWMHPCYSYKGKNIVLIHEFKDYCALLFVKGALLEDPNKILVQQTENSQSARQIRLTGTALEAELEPIIKSYILEAIEVEKSGVKIEKTEISAVEVPEELALKFEENQIFADAFSNLTPGRKRGYYQHFSQPKKSETKTARIEQNMQRILDGYGLNDCTCGLSKRKPNCDGSHKNIGQNL